MKILPVFVVVVLVLILFVFYPGYRQMYLMDAKSDELTQFTVEPGSGLSLIASNLKSEGLIKSEFWFKVQARLSGDATRLHAGTFNLPTRLNYAELTDILQASASKDIAVTIPEGLSNTAVAEIIAVEFDFTESDFLAAAEDYEGFLFPDTYRFFPNVTPSEIVEVMRQNFERRIDEAGIDIEMRDLILASILEREVRSYEDMRRVADLINRRIEIGMPLQMDSTVNYFTGKGMPSITFADRDRQHPYNTYQNRGLTPGPISNPGIDALRAAVNPLPNPALYFLTPPSGEVIYAETYDGHRANITQYLR
jgi:UPF0755 protein